MITMPKETTIRVVRAFLYGGEPVAVGTVMRIDTPFAREVIGYGKAVETKEQPSSLVVAEPAEAVKQDEPKPRRGRKGE